MKKLFKTMTVTLILVFCMGMTVSAKPYGIAAATAETFDYDWYLQQHPDLAAIFSADDHEAIWNFYQTTGEPAGWLGRRSQLSYYTKYNFDYDYFMENNPDVVAALGTDKDVLFDWFLTMGYAANRPAKTIYEDTNAKIKAYEMAEQLTDSTMSVREKAKAIHDWLCINVAYDIENYYAGTIPRSSYDIQGPLFYGKAVCRGYAETFQVFMDIMGVDCEKVVGTANNGVTIGRHAWNRVKIDGEWLYVDVTWDDPAPEPRPGTVYRYQYFLISESQMNQNHYPSEYY